MAKTTGRETGGEKERERRGGRELEKTGESGR